MPHSQVLLYKFLLICCQQISRLWGEVSLNYEVDTAHPMLTLTGIDMTDKFIPLESDDDVILLEKDTFKVSRLKELLQEETRNKFQQHIYEYKSLDPGVSMLEFLRKISLGQQKINLLEIQHNYVTDCQVLRIGGLGWLKGKLKIQICISAVNHNQNQLSLEFCPDDPSTATRNS